jgi:hypothetical protein
MPTVGCKAVWRWLWKGHCIAQVHRKKMLATFPSPAGMSLGVRECRYPFFTVYLADFLDVCKVTGKISLPSSYAQRASVPAKLFPRLLWLVHRLAHVSPWLFSRSLWLAHCLAYLLSSLPSCFQDGHWKAYRLAHVPSWLPSCFQSGYWTA